MALLLGRSGVAERHRRAGFGFHIAITALQATVPAKTTAGVGRMQSAVLSIADAQPFDAEGGANDWVSTSNCTAPPRKRRIASAYICSELKNLGAPGCAARLE